MALVAEDGTGKSDANSYITLTDANTYFTNKGAPAAWTAASDAEKEAALITATQYLDAHYRWITGEIGSSTQSLGWPRDGAYDRFDRSLSSTEVPDRVKDACCEAAARALSTDLLADQAQKVLEQEVVGAVRVRYSEGSSQGTTYPLVDQLLAGLAASSSYEVEIVRS
jgi:hypothetical protein